MSSILDRAVSQWEAARKRSLDITELGVTAHFSVLSLEDRIAAVSGPDSEQAFRMAKVVANHAKDENGQPLFGDPSPDVIDKLRKHVDPAIVDRLSSAILTGHDKAQAEKN